MIIALFLKESTIFFRKAKCNLNKKMAKSSTYIYTGNLKKKNLESPSMPPSLTKSHFYLSHFF